jgi:hypothetical protein
MLSNNMLSFLVLAAVALSVIYLLRKDSGQSQFANNDGALGAPAAYDDSTPAISTVGCPGIAVIPMGKQLCSEQVENINSPACQVMPSCGTECDYRTQKVNNNILAYPQVSNNYAPQTAVNQQFSNTVPMGCVGGRDILSSTDLLPREDGYNVWQSVNPQSQGNLTDQNFLESGYHYGINTVGQSLKNPNLQLRSDPIIAKRDIGPFLQSTFEPDTNRRFFEIGQC